MVQIFYERVMHKEGERNAANEKKNLEELERPLGALDRELEGRDHVLGGGFTVADLNLASCFTLATAMKLVQPRCQVFGVEPEGADTMRRSFAAGRPEGIDAVRTIADSLGAPHAAPYSFALCRAFVDRLVAVSDEALRDAMRLLFRGVKLAVEPAGAAATAALLGPLRETLRGRRTALVMSGTNIDVATFARLAGP